ncbi:MAG: DUF4855 domain-containing protein [Bacillota bacterium]
MKLKVLITVVLLLLAGGTGAYCSPGVSNFNDIKGSYAEESIIRLASQGIIGGAAPGEFLPNDSITRLQFVVLLAKTLGIQPVFPPEKSFSDIPAGTVEAGYVEALARLGIVKGAGGGFGPEGPLLRQDAAVLIHGALGKGYERPSLNDRYMDKGHISPYAYNGVAFVTGRGWMSGRDSSFYPFDYLTRAEAASLAARLLESRRKQALTAFPVVSPAQARVKEGETGKIEPRSAGIFPPFTQVYGTDSPEVCTVDPERSLIYGKNQGKGTITVNGGYNSYTVKTEVSPLPGGRKTDTVPGEVYSGTLASDQREYGLSYTLKQHAPDISFQQTEHKNNPGPAEGLASKSEIWTGFLRQQGRDLTVDLKAPLNVSQISLEFWHNPGWGIYLPNYIKCEVSVDGVAWYHLGYAYHGVSQSDLEAREINLTLYSPPVTARYIRVSFPVDIWVFARHLSVKGRPGTDPAVLAPSGPDSGLAGNYMQVPNVNDILLIYTGENSDYQNITLADFLPLVGYQDSNRKVVGRMFDTMLFLPYHGIPSTRDSWAAYQEDLFAPGKQLMALDEAVARMNTLTGLQIREKVILSIPYPDINQANFGLLGDDKETLNFSEKIAGKEKAAKNRLSVVQWYYQGIMERWSSAGFKNLDLIGIYWYGEAIESNIGETELVQSTARLARKDNLNFFWIPYFGTKGYENWRSYGFSHVFLQPNYFAMDGPPEDRMDRAAEAARRYGMGIEVELDENVLYDRKYYELFYSQLKKGHQLGFDGAMTNAYYAGHVKKTLVKASRSSDPHVRAIYDDLYRWISGTYN